MITTVCRPPCGNPSTPLPVYPPFVLPAPVLAAPPQRNR